MDKSNFRMIMTHFQIEPEKIQFVDLDHEDVDLREKHFVLTTDRSLIKVTRALIAAGTYKATELLGRDVVDPTRGFHLFNIPITVNDMMGSMEDKMLTKAKLDQLVKYYKNYFPFDDALPDMTAGPSDNGAVEDVSVNGSKVENVEQPLPEAIEPVVTKAMVEKAPINTELGDIPIDVNECLNALYEHVNLADNGLGKSLSKYEKFTLSTGSGDLTVYPTNRVPEADEGLKITFKDLVTVLKVSVHLNAGTITFGEKNGTNISD